MVSSTQEGKEHLPREFISPPAHCSKQILNTVQKRWHAPIVLQEIFRIAPTQTRTVIRFLRENLEGRVTGIGQVTVPANNVTAKTSVSFSRRPAKSADFVRGAAGYLPFVPGGLEGIDDIDASDIGVLGTTQRLEDSGGNRLSRVIEFGVSSGLLDIAPGLGRGITPSKTQKSYIATEVEASLTEEPALRPQKPFSGSESTQLRFRDKSCGGGSDVRECIDSLLPIEFPAFEPHGLLGPPAFKKKSREWAHMVDVNRGIANFDELIPNMAKKWPFDLDTFQKEAIYHLENNDSVFVAAHTSAGKTVVAEYAIALAAKHMTKAIYTSPIKALSNQKFRDFKQDFESVGILTGDVQINPEASCLIMTTEILRSMLYRGADILRDVEFVIFDEVHYVNDLERGVVWEEVLIMLPAHITLIMLSATVPNTYEFASWVGRTKQQNIYVISTPKRPVPLEHFLWTDKKLHKIVDANKKFSEAGWKEANLSLSGRNDLDGIAAKQNNMIQHGASIDRGASTGRGPRQMISQQRGNKRGSGPSQRGVGNIGRTGRGGSRTSAAQDRNTWVHLIHHLRKQTLLPCCIFVFSKKRCEENADALSNSDFCTVTEKSAIHSVIERSVRRLRPEDRQLPQIHRLRELLGRGVAVHHGGLLPIVKEIVEILFARTLVKVLFATETFAMGLNLPTRTVVFSGFRKHDGRSFRNLTPGEYTQMAGRAGRRGLDSVGSVVIVSTGSDEAPPAAVLKQMILGDPTKLRSQFRLTYNMILNLLRVEALNIEEMIKRSFSENASQALLPEHERKVRLSKANLSKVIREPCELCDLDLETCHDAAMAFKAINQKLSSLLITLPAGRRLFSSRRLVVFCKDGIRKPGIIARDLTSVGPRATLEVISLAAKKRVPSPNDLLPFLPKFKASFAVIPTSPTEMDLQVQRVLLTDVALITRTVVKIDLAELAIDSESFQANLALHLPPEALNWQSTIFDEFEWKRFNELQMHELLQERARSRGRAEESLCLACPQFVNHFAVCHQEWLIKQDITHLQQLMSDQNLQLLPDYEQRISVLRELTFIDKDSRLELKGKVACEIHSADELVLTELVLENVLADFTPEEIVALLSSFVFQERTDVTPNLTPNLKHGQDIIISISEKVNSYQIQHQVILSSDDSNDFVSRPRFGLMEVVYEWARGMSFNRITDLTDVLEGTIVRVISRLDETCREVKNAARIIGDPGLFTKMQTAQELIKRDITATASLYT